MKGNKDIILLDCTLRDGGHLTNSYFGREVIIDIISKLIESNIDVIEAGFLKDCIFDENVACYNNIEEAMSVLPKNKGNSSYSLMLQEDLYDISKLEKCDGKIEIIRVSFHEFDLNEGLECAQKVVDKGYKCFINPINILGYDDEKLLKIIAKVNQIHPEGFTIVDTFGSMRKKDLMRLYYLVDHNLEPDIKIAIHLHENQAMAFSLAQSFIEIKSLKRHVCIDGSLYGMGRIPGNLCIELIMEYINEYMGEQYNMEPIYDAIDDYIIDIKNKIPWGYSTAYALSAHHRLHRTYAEFLLDKGKLRTKQINQILSMIDPEHKARFDKKYIEELYQKYQNNEIDNTKVLEKLKSDLKDKSVLLIAPGRSLEYYQNEILEKASEVDITISVGFVWEKLICDYFFCSNIKRWDMYGKKNYPSKKIITSNLIPTNFHYDFVINFSDYCYSLNEFFDDSGIMAIKFLINMNVKNIYLAGFDGYKNDKNFVVPQLEVRPTNEMRKSQFMMTQILASLKKDNPIYFVTPSSYEEQ